MSIATGFEAPVIPGVRAGTHTSKRAGISAESRQGAQISGSPTTTQKTENFRAGLQALIKPLQEQTAEIAEEKLPETSTYANATQNPPISLPSKSVTPSLRAQETEQSEPEVEDVAVKSASTDTAKLLSASSGANTPARLAVSKEAPSANETSSSKHAHAEVRQNSAPTKDKHEKANAGAGSSQGLELVLNPIPTPAISMQGTQMTQSSATLTGHRNTESLAANESVHAQGKSTPIAVLQTAKISSASSTVSIASVRSSAEPTKSITSNEDVSSVTPHSAKVLENVHTEQGPATHAEDAQAPEKHSSMADQTDEIEIPDKSIRNVTPSMQNNVQSIANSEASVSTADSSSLHAHSLLGSEPASSAQQQMQAIAIDSQVHVAALHESTSIVNPQGDRGGNPVLISRGESSAPATSDTFAALDSAPRQQTAMTWTHTNTRQAEAGYLDPTLGWVSVRADVTTNGVHASVVPSSTEAAQALGNHLAGLNTYLSAHHGSTVTASLAAPEEQRAAYGQSGQGNAEHSAGQQGGNRSNSTGTSTENSDPLTAHDAEPTTAVYKRAGSISVIA